MSFNNIYHGPSHRPPFDQQMVSTSNVFLRHTHITYSNFQRWNKYVFFWMKISINFSRQFYKKPESCSKLMKKIQDKKYYYYCRHARRKFNGYKSYPNRSSRTRSKVKKQSSAFLLRNPNSPLSFRWTLSAMYVIAIEFGNCLSHPRKKIKKSLKFEDGFLNALKHIHHLIRF